MVAGGGTGAGSPVDPPLPPQAQKDKLTKIAIIIRHIIRLTRFVNSPNYTSHDYEKSMEVFKLTSFLWINSSLQYFGAMNVYEAFISLESCKLGLLFTKFSQTFLILVLT
jgi:hypothetical protein